MHIRNLHLYRALRGGVWERDPSGWYRLTGDEITRRACRVPARVMAREDYRIWHAYIVLCACMTVAACVAALIITIKGV